MDKRLETLGDAKHVVRSAQIKAAKFAEYLGGVVEMIEELIEKEGEE